MLLGMGGGWCQRSGCCCRRPIPGGAADLRWIDSCRISRKRRKSVPTTQRQYTAQPCRHGYYACAAGPRRFCNEYCNLHYHNGIGGGKPPRYQCVICYTSCAHVYIIAVAKIHIISESAKIISMDSCIPSWWRQYGSSSLNVQNIHKKLVKILKWYSLMWCF